jgi:hypothetical protein
MRHGDFFRSRGAGGCQFWKSLHKIKHLFKWGAIHSVGNGWCTQFWGDVWLGDTPLRIQFTKLYEVCSVKKAMVAECAMDNWQIQFQRVLCPEAQVEWTELQDLLLGVHLTTEPDVIRWGLTTSGRFTTSSTSGGVDSKTAERI